MVTWQSRAVRMVGAALLCFVSRRQREVEAERKWSMLVLS